MNSLETQVDAVLLWCYIMYYMVLQYTHYVLIMYHVLHYGIRYAIMKG